ncbi:hypothetical protein O181_041089 [Austropuccinia psidii MF-1]|uniref:Uncharacterized protein n=1 Tax=Austropuccinia psidii MF-1 TaxID=1389203 RepID=A0A9Q3DDR3_9BASI|nr:hypothetical protein [Austropuccinia psidii MF-1]
MAQIELLNHNSNGAKRCQGRSPEASNSRWVPNHKWAHLSIFFPKIQEDPKLVQLPKAPRMAIASGNHQRPPVTFNKGVPLKIRETSGPAQWTQVSRHQEWCIYGILYHYAPFFLRNSMVKLSGLHYSISNQGSKPITHFEGRLQLVIITINGSDQKIIWGPQLLGFPAISYVIPKVFPQGNTGLDSSRAI